RMLLNHRRGVAAARGQRLGVKGAEATTLDLPPSQGVSFEVGGAERGGHPQAVQLGGDGPLLLVDRRTVTVVDRVVVGVGVAVPHGLVVLDLLRLVILVLVDVVERLSVVLVVGVARKVTLLLVLVVDDVLLVVLIVV